MKHDYETRYNKDWMPFANPLGFIRLILLVDFDFIRILGHVGAMDEYDTYARKVHDLFQSGAGPAKIAAYLSGVQGNLGSSVFEPEYLMSLAEKSGAPATRLSTQVKTADD